MDFGTTHQPQETTDDSALLLSHKVNSTGSHSVSCPTLVIPERKDTSREAQQTELSPTDQAELEKADYGDLLAKHSECCSNPCGVDCPMYPVYTIPEVLYPKQEETTGTSNSTDCSCSYTAQDPYNAPHASQQQPNTTYAYYWDSATGQYYLLPESQPTQCSGSENSTASQYFSGQQASQQDTLNTITRYAYAYNFYAVHYAELYQQYSASEYSSGCEEILSIDDADLPLPMSDRKRRRLLREMNKTAELCQKLWNYSYQNIQPEYSYSANYHQASSFQPTVLQSDFQSVHSSAAPLINGQYESSPHTLDTESSSPQDPQYKYTLDMENLLKDFL